MKHLYDYIMESSLEDHKKLKNAAKKIFDILKKPEKLKDYVGELNKILTGTAEGENSDNTKLWLKALIGLFTGNGSKNSKAYNDFKCTGETDIKCTELFPTQNEIDIVNSAKWTKGEDFSKGVANMFKPGFGKDFGVPVLVYDNGSKKWIIDGHHRWSQCSLLNRETSLRCMVITGKVEPQEFLKLTQSIIASTIAIKDNGVNGDNGKLPEGKANKDNNIFGKALEGDKLKDKIVKMFGDNKDAIDTVAECLKANNIKVESAEDIAALATKNRDEMIKNGQTPEDWAEDRPVMPQSDRAGKMSNKDSALSKLKKVKRLPKIG